MRPLIGIGGRLVKDVAWCPPVIGHRQGYVDAILQAGGLPVVLPPTADEVALRAMVERLDGIMLAGGEDIAPVRYNEAEHPLLGTISYERDTAELPLARWAIGEGKPVLGICRGIQVLNVALGGSLWQDIIAQCPGSLDHEVGVKTQDWETLNHLITLEPDSRMAEFLGTVEIGVNSLHHQAVKDLGSGLRIVGRAPDGVVEAIEGTGTSFVMAVQCHPEQLWQESETRWRNLFKAFIEACRTAAMPQDVALYGAAK